MSSFFFCWVLLPLPLLMLELAIQNDNSLPSVDNLIRDWFIPLQFILLDLSFPMWSSPEYIIENQIFFVQGWLSLLQAFFFSVILEVSKIGWLLKMFPSIYSFGLKLFNLISTSVIIETSYLFCPAMTGPTAVISFLLSLQCLNVMDSQRVLHSSICTLIFVCNHRPLYWLFDGIFLLRKAFLLVVTLYIDCGEQVCGVGIGCEYDC